MFCAESSMLDIKVIMSNHVPHTVLLGLGGSNCKITEPMGPNKIQIKKNSHYMLTLYGLSNIMHQIFHSHSDFLSVSVYTHGTHPGF